MRETVAAEVRTVNAINPAERFQAGTRERLLSSDRLGWSGFGAELVGIGAGVHRVPAAAEHRVGMHIGAPVTAHCRCDGRRSSRIQSQGDVDVIPAGLDGQWADDASCTILRIAFTEEFAQRTLSRLDRRGAVARITPRLQWRDPRLQHLAWALRAELEAPHASDALYAESLGVAMIIRLADGDDDSASRSTKPALNRSAAMRVVDYIDAHLDRSLALAELAEVAGLSVPHFKLLFRRTFGTPVHQFVVEKRVERAKRLLLQGGLPVSQVALDCGFAHASHMAHWMKRMLGVTPREVEQSERRT
ncbi:AraC family transcriptional regulator [Burkholderia sp. SJZ115]|nr:AraC family transcriptional regulator [Burkholderia gladioli]TWC61487.1 AraC family transcriptional regulator [Burkholderia sp. SJZ089]TWC95077.1 AraC family transcriptional regulator [Burkholderia sp. SJZ115]TWC97690.1 AraC family transcriptional regulator [Burkholderia sp. SJZ091]